jgi:hypothetical protein
MRLLATMAILSIALANTGAGQASSSDGDSRYRVAGCPSAESTIRVFPLHHATRELRVSDEDRDGRDDLSGEKVRVLSMTESLVTEIAPLATTRHQFRVTTWTPSLQRLTSYAPLRDLAVREGECLAAGHVLGTLARGPRELALQIDAREFRGTSSRALALKRVLNESTSLPENQSPITPWPYPWLITAKATQTLASLPVPAGWQRVARDHNSYEAWLRGLPISCAQAACQLDIGSPHTNLEERLRAEYALARGEPAMIALTRHGQRLRFVDWLREGQTSRPMVPTRATLSAFLNRYAAKPQGESFILDTAEHPTSGATAILEARFNADTARWEISPWREAPVSGEGQGLFSH